jgi:hypothetical protein
LVERPAIAVDNGKQNDAAHNMRPAAKWRFCRILRRMIIPLSQAGCIESFSCSQQ